MRISRITSRILGCDVSAIYGKATLAIDIDGMRHLPDAPGLGVEMDWDWVENHTVEMIRTGAA